MPSYSVPDDKVPNNEAVARLMEERGIGRRYAYALARKAAAEAIDVSDVTLSQKEAILLTLVEHPDITNAAELKEVMRHDGSTIDGHDTAKMLWACQKSGWVKFRESHKRGIYAIKVTEKGLDALDRKQRADDIKEEDAAPAVDGHPPFVKPDEFKVIRSLMKQAKVADRLNEAAKILEEAGEEDIALTVYGKTEFNNLEMEVIRLIRKLENIYEDWTLEEVEEKPWA